MRKQRDDAVVQGDKHKAQSLRGKIGETENMVREMQKKDKDLKELKKMVGTQQNRIKDLDIELKKFKELKMQLVRKNRE
jgi:hypothetical protein